jgi:hypothetical protein
VKEQELFDYLKANKFSDLVRSTGIYDSFDCLTTEHNLYIELKCRYKHYPELLIEKSKYDKLIAEAKGRGMKPWYINSTPNGKWAFDLSVVPEPAWSSRLMPATTEFNNTRRVFKTVGFLWLKHGQEI